MLKKSPDNNKTTLVKIFPQCISFLQNNLENLWTIPDTASHFQFASTGQNTLAQKQKLRNQYNSI